MSYKSIRKPFPLKSQGVRFNGTSGYLSNTSLLKVNTNSIFSIYFFGKIDITHSNFSTIIGDRSTNTSSGWEIRSNQFDNQGKIGVTFNSVADYVSDIVTPTGFSGYVIIIDNVANTIDYYVGHLSDLANATTDMVLPLSDGFTIGARDKGSFASFAKGIVTEFAYFNRRLSAMEATLLASAKRTTKGFPLRFAPMVYLPLDHSYPTSGAKRRFLNRTGFYSYSVVSSATGVKNEPGINSPTLYFKKRSLYLSSSATSATAQPSLASVTITAFQATATTSSVQSATATPALASVTIQTFTATASTSKSATASPALAEVSFQVFSPSVSVNNSAVAQPALATVTVTAFQATASTSASATATPALATISITAFQATASTSAQQNATALPALALISFTAFDVTVSTGMAGGAIGIHFLLHSQIDKFLNGKSGIANTFLNNSKISKKLLGKSEIDG